MMKGDAPSAGELSVMNVPNSGTGELTRTHSSISTLRVKHNWTFDYSSGPMVFREGFAAPRLYRIDFVPNCLIVSNAVRCLSFSWSVYSSLMFAKWIDRVTP
jgi:hypothetical protein